MTPAAWKCSQNTTSRFCRWEHCRGSSRKALLTGSPRWQWYRFVSAQWGTLLSTPTCLSCSSQLGAARHSVFWTIPSLNFSSEKVNLPHNMSPAATEACVVASATRATPSVHRTVASLVPGPDEPSKKSRTIVLTWASRLKLRKRCVLYICEQRQLQKRGRQPEYDP